MVINCLLYGQVIYLSLQWWKWKRWEDIQQMGGRRGCMVAICGNTSFLSYLEYRKDKVGEQCSDGALFFLLLHIFAICVSGFHHRGLLSGSGRLRPLLRFLWGLHHCGAPTRVAPHELVKKKKKKKCSVESAGRKSGEELFTPSNPCQCCELRYFCSPWQLHDFPLSPSVWLCAGFILPLFARSSGTITCCAGWELTEKHGTTWLLINTEKITCQSQAAMVAKVEL